jgi:hypothetical protein
MHYDLTHALVVGVLILLVLEGLNRSNILDGMSKGRVFMTRFVSVFIVVLALNLIWPV